MNTLTKQIIGATIGGMVGWFVGGIIVEIIALKELDEYYHDTEEFPQGDEDVESPNGRILKIEMPSKTQKKTKVKNYTRYFLEEKRPDLAQLASKYGGEEEVDETATLLNGEQFEADNFEIVEDEIISDIMIISMEEYAENANGYHAITLNYYEDEVLTDEHNNPIDHPEQILGDEALVSFGELSGDEDVVYVRNDPKKALYEVVRTNRPFLAQVRRRREALSKKQVEKEELDEGDDT